jgi:thiopeptide-type bacteriocin biosynthesis protein
MNNKTATGYSFLPQLFLRAPHYSFGGYDLSRMPEVLQQTDFRNALWLASPEFYRILQAKEFKFDQLLPKEIHTLQKYYNRICYRSTPFGSFASFTLLRWADDSPIRLQTAEKAFIHLRPDQQTLNLLNNWQGRNNPEHLIVNPTLYRFDKFFRYTKTTQSDKSRYIFSIEAWEAVNFNISLVALFKHGQLPVAKVLEYITRKGACTAEEAQDHLRFLLDEQVLYCPSTGSIIGMDPYMLYGNWPEGWAASLKKYHRIPLTQTQPVADVARELSSSLEGILPLNPPQPLYAALEKPWESGGPGPDVQQDIAETIAVLERLAINREPEDLVKFIKAFQARFDLERVPVLAALDPDIGISYANLHAQETNMNPLENIGFPEKGDPKESLGWTPVHRMIIRLWTGDTLREYWSPLVLKKEHLAGLPDITAAKVDLPQTLALMYRPTGEHLIIDHADGVAAPSLIGRFSCFSDEVQQFCRDLADLECSANPDVVFADIGQRSDSHVDNINRRSAIYPYEIPVNVFSVLPLDRQIRPEDLLLSVSGGQLILESASLGKRVVPRLASAYNFRNNNLPLFRLLCDLQYQGLQAGLSFNLESLFPGLPFYPRVAYGHTVLSLAKWKFKEADVQHLLNVDDRDTMSVVKAFRSAHHLPRYISLGTYDQQLVFDLAQVAEARFFRDCLRGIKDIVIQEYLMPARSVLSGNKPLAGQLVAFLSHQKNIYPGINVMTDQYPERNDRRFLLGSDWLYLKVYCTPRVADLLLLKVIHPFTKTYRLRIKKWFFIRYEENGHHLRLRIQADPADLGELLVLLREKLVAGGYDKLIKNYQGDTYQREVERYGLRHLPQIENLFCAGSELVVRALKLRAATEWGELELALMTAERMISCFIKEDSDRLSYLNRVTDQFILEFKGDKALILDLDSKYREMRSLIKNLPASRFQTGIGRKLITEMTNLKHLTKNYPNDKSSALLADLVHMQLNRTFTVQQRQQELLVYYVLRKETASRIARSR